jgi:uncharacterized protein YeaO (DUF488 family)
MDGYEAAAEPAGRPRPTMTRQRRMRQVGVREPVRLRRINDDFQPDDGKRVLVDRLWPRGLTPQAAPIDLWLRDAAPSASLRRWYGHQPERFEEFRRRYLSELAEPLPAAAVNRLRVLMRIGRVTLLTAAKDVDRSHAAVLAELLCRRGRHVPAPAASSRPGR